MQIPSQIPGYRILVILFGVYAGMWIILEGDLMRVVVMGLAASLILLGWFVQRFFGGRRLSLSHWFILCAFGGLIFAATFTLLTLLFMAVKTGLHAHGPEFSVAEISWLLNRWVVWAIAAALGGLGLGALAAFMAKATP